MIGGDGHLKLGDFGLSKIREDRGRTKLYNIHTAAPSKLISSSSLREKKREKEKKPALEQSDTAIEARLDKAVEWVIEENDVDERDSSGSIEVLPLSKEEGKGSWPTKQRRQQRKNTIAVGTPDYMAPELLPAPAEGDANEGDYSLLDKRRFPQFYF